MARRRDPQTGKLLPEGIYPIISERTGAVTYRARTHYSIGKRRKHLSKVCKTAQAAIDWKLETDLQMNRGQFNEPSRITVEQYFNQWMERQKKEWSASFYLLAEGFWRNHATPVLGDMRLLDVTRSHVQLVVDEMSETLAPASVKTYSSFLRAMFARAEDEEIIQRTPYRRIQLPRVDDEEPTVWSPLQLRYFLHKTRDHRHGPIWAFMIATGCRVSEAIGLRPDALDLEKGIVRIFRTEAVNEMKRRVVVERTKSRKRELHIRLEPWIIDVLKAQPEGDYVFMVNGRRVQYWMLREDFIEVRRSLDLPEMRLHGLRHSVASMMSNAGVDIAVIKSIVGHTSIQRTADTYVRTSVAGQEIGTRTVARLLGFDPTDTTTLEENDGKTAPDASTLRQN